LTAEDTVFAYYASILIERLFRIDQELIKTQRKKWPFLARCVKEKSNIRTLYMILGFAQVLHLYATFQENFSFSENLIFQHLLRFCLLVRRILVARNLLLFGLWDEKILHDVVDHISGQVIRVVSFFSGSQHSPS